MKKGNKNNESYNMSIGNISIMNIIKDKLNTTNIDSLFDIVGSGQTTIVIETGEEMFLVLTTDKKKRSIYDISEIETKNFVSNNVEAFNKLKHSLELFYVEKLEKVEINYILELSIDLVEMTLPHVFDVMLNKDKFVFGPYSFKDYLEDLQIDIDSMLDSDLERLESLVKATFDSMHKIATKYPGVKVNIDLHTGQYLKKNNKIICIDPFVFI